MPRRVPAQLVLNSFLPYRLATLSQRISQALSSIYREEFGVSVPEWRILANLAEKGELSPSEIAAQTSMDRARVTRGIKDLRAKRCLLKRRDASDQRAYRLRLSQTGEALYSKIVPLARAWEQSLLQSLEGAEHRELLRILDKLSERLDTPD
jgi:DNA-binding MarR family transcriptional regulator